MCGCVMLLAAAATRCAFGQSNATSSAAATPPTAEQAIAPAAVRDLNGRIQYVGPDTYILLDAEGRPQPLPGMTYEDFLAAWKSTQQAPVGNRQPRYLIEDSRIDGAIVGPHAELKFELTVRLLTAEPVAVPIGLADAILQRPPEFDRESRVEVRESRDESRELEKDASAAGPARDARGSDLDFLHLDPEQRAWIARFIGRPGERRRLTLQVLVPVAHEGGESRLAFAAPRAQTGRMNMIVRDGATEFQVSTGKIIAQQPATEGTRLEIVGAVGPFQLSWRDATRSSATLSSVLSAAGAIKVSVDGRSIRTDARLTVESYAGPFDRFRVRLPAGSRLIQTPTSDAESDGNYRISLEEGDATADARPRAGQTVLVQLAAPQSNPVVVNLSTEQPLGATDADATHELAGFEVLGAVRQYGDIAVAVDDDWQIRWELGPHIRPVDPSELTARLQQPRLNAAFQYDGQPWSLGIRVTARRLRMYVTPQYEMEVLQDEARVRVRLAFQVLGARAFEFRVDMKGWELTADAIESGGAIDREHVVLTREGALVLPLAQASTRRAEIAFVARRAVAREAELVALPLPAPLAESIGVGELAVRAAPGIELTPDMSTSRGLTAVPIVDGARTPPVVRSADFRFQCTPPEIVFAAQRVDRPRAVLTEAQARVQVDSTTVRLDQRIQYLVRFEPIQELTFEIPAELPFQLDQAEVTLLTSPAAGGSGDGAEAPVRFSEAAASSDAPAGEKMRRVRVPLPQPRLGQFTLRVATSWRHRAAPADASLAVPLFVSIDGTSGPPRVVAERAPNVTVGLDPRAAAKWQRVSNADGVVEFLAAGAENALPLVVRAADSNLPSATIVERIWLQTWIAQGARQDRAAFRFRTTGSRVTVELPPEIDSGDIEILLNGQPVQAISRSAGRLVVPAASESRAGGRESRDESRESRARSDSLDHNSFTHTLELRYRQSINPHLVARWRLTPPQLVAVAGLSELYWQVVLPGDQHIVAPPNLIPSARWQWLGSFFGRTPTMTQSALEDWVGSSRGIAPAGARCEYLYSGLASAGTIELVTAPRWLIVLAASGVVLAIALAWRNVPAARRGWHLVVIGTALGVAALAFPTLAVMLAQASILGLVLGAIAHWIARATTRPALRPLVAASGSTQRQLSPRLGSAAPPMGSAATASTASPVVASAEESKR
jgi:hypothetical protein